MSQRPPESDPPPLPAAALALCAMAAVYFCAFFQRTAVPGTIFNELQADFGLSASGVAGLGALFFYLYAALQIVAGYAVDRWGGVRVLIATGAALAAGAILFPLARTPAELYAARALTGVGGSFMFLCVVREIDPLFGARRFPLALGAAVTLGYAGGVMGLLPFERAAAACGWRAALLAVGVFTALAVVASALVLRRRPRPPRGGAVSLAPLLEVLRNRRSLPLVAWNLTCFPVYFAIQTVLGQKFLRDVAGLSAPAAAGVALGMMIVGCFMGVGGGLLVRWCGERRKPALYLAAAAPLGAAALLLAGVLSGAPAWCFGLAYLVLALQAVASPPIIATMKELNRAEFMGVAVSVLNGAAYVGVAVVAHAAGFILDRFRDQARISPEGMVYPAEAYAWVFGLLIVLSLASLLLTLRIPETGGRPQA